MVNSWFLPQKPSHRPKVPAGTWKSALVPLDGSALSRWAVDRARVLLERAGISVTLLRVIECGDEAANDLGYQMDSRHREAREQLAEVRAGFGERAAEVSADLRFGNPATEILRETSEGNHDVVLLSTYGRAGLGRPLLGSVVRNVLRSSPIPLLLFRPSLAQDGELSRYAAADETRFRQVLVALDGSSMAEEIVPAVETMARTLGSTLHLFRAVAHETERPQAEAELKNAVHALTLRGIAAQAIVKTGDPADAAVGLIRDRGLDAAALATRLRGGLTLAVCGSMTRELLRGADVPILTLCAVGRRRQLPASAAEHRRVWVQ